MNKWIRLKKVIIIKIGVRLGSLIAEQFDWIHRDQIDRILIASFAGCYEWNGFLFPRLVTSRKYFNKMTQPENSKIV